MADAFLMWMVLPNIVANSLTISDVITEDTSFYYRRFQTFPSQLATLEYSVMFNITRINHQCGIASCTVILDIYTTEHDKNFFMNCSLDPFGQLRNENLRTPLYLRHQPYRFTICKLDELDPDVLHCEGKTSIQDYKPRHYGFSFSYKCSASVKPSLVGLWYNFTISAQSNKTQCVPFSYSLPGNIRQCFDFYNHISLPNMIGNPDVKSAQESMSVLEGFYPLLSDTLSQLPTGDCYKYIQEFFCRLFIPECDPVENQVIHICKETCSEFVHACIKQWEPIIYSKVEKLKKMGHLNISHALDCNYLPSVSDPIPCHYKPVTCNPPPDVTNALIINGSGLNRTYLAMSHVVYECLNKTFVMEGNSTVTCLYSGEWDKLPKCEAKYASNVNPLSIVIPLLIVPFCILIITHIARGYVCRRKELLLLKRNREYDAFVCYNFDEDHDFVFDSILPELEENHHRPLKLLIHDRDFTPGREISINIYNAINNCNSAIILMSQGFVDSPRCKEEFTKCLAESEEDPAFKLFIIMMTEIDTLDNVPENMKMFFREKTYLKRDDPELFEKIANHLKLMRQHNVMDDNAEYYL